MPLFEYEALTSSGRMMKGTLEAASPQQARLLLEEMQLKVNSLEPAATRGPSGGIGRSEFILFNQQLASITKAGIPLEGGLRQLSQDVQSPAMRRLVVSLADDLAAGTPVEEAFEKHRAQFPPLYGLIVKAGVQSGRLSEMLTSLNRHLEVSTMTRRIIFDAVAYPLVVLSIAAALLTAVVYIVIPSFRLLFEGMGLQLPAMTRFVMSLPDSLHIFWLSVAGVALVAATTSLVLRGTAGFQRMMQAIYLRVPVVGRLYHRGLLSRLSDAMALLVGAGCDLPTTVRLAAGTTGSHAMADECERVAAAVERGEGLFQAGQQCRIVPPLVFYSMQLGSQRGELQENLYSLSDMYGQQVRASQARLQALLLPLMLISVGTIIGLIACGLFLPMVSMIQAVGGGLG